MFFPMLLSILMIPGCQGLVEHHVPLRFHLFDCYIKVAPRILGFRRDLGREFGELPLDLLEPLVDLLEPLVDLLEPLVDLLEPLVDLLEQFVHLVSQRTEFHGVFHPSIVPPARIGPRRFPRDLARSS